MSRLHNNLKYLGTFSVEVDDGPDFFRQARRGDALRDTVDVKDELARRRFKDADAVVLLKLVEVGWAVVFLEN